ncbi:hypothetical protein LPJ53_003315 [Coemansia erecta]|uniref:Ribosomal protein n=1 Tax=Coemansia erecta TaxID=147472 RepID=A0A9W7Y0C5_9FUNG|nr:hypothetical protein LPJ53_003315 [Coemansia erecta]
MQHLRTLARLTPRPSHLTPPAARGFASRRAPAPHANAVPLTQAIHVLKSFAVGQPQQTVELHVHCTPDKGQPPIRGSCILPRAHFSDIKVLVFADGDKATEALAAGADHVGGDELVTRVKEGLVKFDKCIATPEMLPRVARIARLLGPRGLMPTVNKGTVTSDVAGLVRYSKNSLDFRADKQFIVHAGVARVGFSEAEIRENVAVVMKAIRANSKASKAKFVSRVYLSSTQGPGVQVADA